MTKKAAPENMRNVKVYNFPSMAERYEHAQTLPDPSALEVIEPEFNAVEPKGKLTAHEIFFIVMVIFAIGFLAGKLSY